jgi:hypothetical protein
VKVYTVEVGVALARPPRTDRTVWYRIAADSGDEAELTAAQWAASRPRVVMPTSAVVIDWED